MSADRPAPGNDPLSIRARAAASGSAPALVAGGEVIPWEAVPGLLRRSSEGAAPAGTSDVFVAHPGLGSVLRVLRGIHRGRPLGLVHPRLPAEAQAQRMAALRERLARLGDGSSAVGTIPEAALCALFTSGSTGPGKLAVSSRRAFAAAARGSAEVLPFGPGDRWLLAMPLAHVGGLSIVARAIHGGGAVVLGGAFDPRRFRETVERDRVTHVSLVPTMLRRLLDVPGDAPASLRVALLGGAPAAASLVAEARGRGWPIHRTYGLTESTAQAATEPAPGAGMRPLPGVRLALDGDGEIGVDGPTLFSGYLEEDGTLALPRRAGDGAFPTGDLGRWARDGSLEVVGRRGDVIISGGENVHPAEVEAVLSDVPGVVEVAAVGEPDAVWGERVVAVWVGDPGAAPRLEEAARARLAPHQRPKAYDRRPALPKNELGKLDRRALRERTG